MARRFYTSGLTKHPEGYWSIRIEVAGGDYVAANIYGSTSKEAQSRAFSAIHGMEARAHPSPPPAADEDRVRIAVAHMSWMRKFVPCVFDVTEERLEEIDNFINAYEAALKSEGK